MADGQGALLFVDCPSTGFDHHPSLWVGLSFAHSSHGASFNGASFLLQPHDFARALQPVVDAQTWHCILDIAVSSALGITGESWY
jgi:hypothetical protein